MRFSSIVVAADEACDLLGDVSNVLDEEMKCLASRGDWDHIFDSFVVGLIAVGIEENEKIAKKNHGVGRYKHPATKKLVRYLRITLTYNPEAIKHLDCSTMRHLVVLDLFEKFKNLDIKLPKDFNLSEFVLHLRTGLCR